MRFSIALQQCVVDDDLLLLSIFGLSHFPESPTICFSIKTISENAHECVKHIALDCKDRFRSISEEKDLL